MWLGSCGQTDGCSCRYANGFQTTTDQWLSRAAPFPLGGGGGAPVTDAAEYDEQGNITPAAYAAHARRWVDAGASVVGGCCGTSPQHIRELQHLRDYHP